MDHTSGRLPVTSAPNAAGQPVLDLRHGPGASVTSRGQSEDGVSADTEVPRIHEVVPRREIALIQGALARHAAHGDLELCQDNGQGTRGHVHGARSLSPSDNGWPIGHSTTATDPERMESEVVHALRGPSGQCRPHGFGRCAAAATTFKLRPACAYSRRRPEDQEEPA